jgi:hypothetical protein
LKEAKEFREKYHFNDNYSEFCVDCLDDMYVNEISDGYRNEDGTPKPRLEN